MSSNQIRRHLGVAAAAGCFFSASCGFGPLVPAPPDPHGSDDLPDAVTVNGIQVSPQVIHPGDHVTLRDPVLPPARQRAPLYHWDACAGGVSQKAPYTREASWLAPMEPGSYDLTVNISNPVSGERSRTLRLCVAAKGQDECGPSPSDPPRMRSLAASSSLVYCGASCEITLESDVESPAGPGELAYRWMIRKGRIVGAGPTVTWQLPTIGCCAETYSASLTVCDVRHGAATGMASVVATPQ